MSVIVNNIARITNIGPLRRTVVSVDASGRKCTEGGGYHTGLLIMLCNDSRKSRDIEIKQLDHANRKKDKVCYCSKVHLLFRSASTIYILHGHLVLGYVLVTSTP